MKGKQDDRANNYMKCVSNNRFATQFGVSQRNLLVLHLRFAVIMQRFNSMQKHQKMHQTLKEIWKSVGSDQKNRKEIEIWRRTGKHRLTLFFLHPSSSCRRHGLANVKLT